MAQARVFKTKHLVDPETFPPLEAFSLAPIVDSVETLADVREQMKKFPFTSADSTGVTIDRRTIKSHDNGPDVPVVIFFPARTTEPLPAYLDMHGGGYVGGYPDFDYELALRIVRELHVVVVSVDYRLAPEHPGTAAVEDCYTALLWMHEHGREVHIDPTQIAIGGYSAGGGLTAALALIARDRKVVRPVFQLLIYPMLDDRTCLRDPGNTGELVVTIPNNIFCWTSHLGKDTPIGSDDVHEYVAPARAKDLSRLPPAYIAVGSLDLFVGECIDYARRLTASDVITEFHMYPGMTHGVDVIAPTSKLGIRFRTDFVDAIGRHIGKNASK